MKSAGGNASGGKKGSAKQVGPKPAPAQTASAGTSKESGKLSAGLIGQRLVEAGYLSRTQVDEVLAAQYETGLLFGEVCLLKGWISISQLEECLPPLRSKLGQSLMVCGYITIEQLYMAILEQRRSGMRLGEILVARGWVDIATLSSIWNEADT